MPKIYLNDLIIPKYDTLLDDVLDHNSTYTIEYTAWVSEKQNYLGKNISLEQVEEWQTAIKFWVVPWLAKRDELKKLSKIDENEIKIKNLSGEELTQEQEIKDIKKQLSTINSRMDSVSVLLVDVSDGVQCLLGGKLGYIDDPKADEEVYRNLKKHSRVV